MFNIELSLQWIVILILGAVLLLKIIMVVYNTLSDKQDWTPGIAPCPDYWDLSWDPSYQGQVCTMNYAPVDLSGQNIGNLQYYTGLGTDTTLFGPTCRDENDYINQTNQTLTIPTSEFGNNKKAWANKYGFVWDGLTSGPKTPFTLKCFNSNPTGKKGVFRKVDRLENIVEAEKTVLIVLSSILIPSIFGLYITGCIYGWWRPLLFLPDVISWFNLGFFFAYILVVLATLLSVGITRYNKKKRVNRFYRTNTEKN